MSDFYHGLLGELKLLEHAISHITEPSRGPVEQDLAAVAGQSSDLWAALGRLVILTAYTAIERLVVTFATDRDVSISGIAELDAGPGDGRTNRYFQDTGV